MNYESSLKIKLYVVVCYYFSKGISVYTTYTTKKGNFWYMSTLLAHFTLMSQSIELFESTVCSTETVSFLLII